MTLPRGFGAGYDYCEDCGSKYAGFHKEDYYKINGKKKKIIIIPIKQHHIAEGLFCFLNFVLLPAFMIKGYVIVAPFYLISGVLLGGGMCIFSDSIRSDFFKVFCAIYKIIPTPSKFGYKVKLKE